MYLTWAYDFFRLLPASAVCWAHSGGTGAVSIEARMVRKKVAALLKGSTFRIKWKVLRGDKVGWSVCGLCAGGDGEHVRVWVWLGL